MTKGPITCCRSRATKRPFRNLPTTPAGERSPQVVKWEDNRSREERALATRAIEPTQLGLAGAAQLGCLHRQSGKDAAPEVEYLVTSRALALRARRVPEHGPGLLGSRKRVASTAGLLGL